MFRNKWTFKRESNLPVLNKKDLKEAIFSIFKHQAGYCGFVGQPVFIDQ